MVFFRDNGKFKSRNTSDGRVSLLADTGLSGDRRMTLEPEAAGEGGASNT